MRKRGALSLYHKGRLVVRATLLLLFAFCMFLPFETVFNLLTFICLLKIKLGKNGITDLPLIKAQKV